MKDQSGSPGANVSGEPDSSPPAGGVRPDHPAWWRGAFVSGLVAVSLLLVGAGALVAAGSSSDPASVSVAGRDAPVNVSARAAEDISAHNSPTLVRNPARPENLAVSSRIDTPFFSCALHVSRDGGANWSQTAVPAPEGQEAKCFGPDVAFSTDGTLYFSFVTLEGNGNTPGALWLTRSTDGGRTLSKPTQIADELTFQVRLAADPVKAGRVYLTWLQGNDVAPLRFTAPGNPVLAARSDDSGKTWSEPVAVSSPRRGRVVTPAPVVGRDGTLYVLYLDLGMDRLDYEGEHNGMGGTPYDGQYTLVLARSEDQGKKWEESVVDEQISPIDRFIVFLAPAPSIAVDSTGRVYASFHDDRLGDPDVLLWTLPPDASDWEGPTRVNDTPRKDGRWQYLPRLSVSPDDRLDVLYYDRRKDPENLDNNVSTQSSFDHGQSFTPALTLNGRASDSRIGFGAKEGLPDLGSRLALISDDKAALAVWTDTRAGTPETQKQDLAEAAITIDTPAQLSDTTKNLLRAGAIIAILAALALLIYTLRPRKQAPA